MSTQPTPNEANPFAAVEQSLSALLDASTTVTGVASAGAVRSTLFVAIHEDEVTEPRSAVAQISAATATFEKTMTIEDEAALIRLAEKAGLPVAEVLAVSAAAPEIDAPVLVCAAVDGETIPRRVLRMIDGHAGSGEALARECGRALALLHSIDPTDVPARVERLDAANPALAYADSLNDWLEQLPSPRPALRFGINWLRTHAPTPPPQTALIHADFRNGNLIVGPPSGSGTTGWLRAVVDWEVAHVGDPMEDLAYLCLRTWRFGSDAPVGGFGPLAALRDSYESHGGVWRQDAFDWWTIARTAWWGLGLAGQADAFVRGDSSSIVHAASGRRVVELEYDMLNLIGDHHGF